MSNVRHVAKAQKREGDENEPMKNPEIVKCDFNKSVNSGYYVLEIASPAMQALTHAFVRLFWRGLRILPTLSWVPAGRALAHMGMGYGCVAIHHGELKVRGPWVYDHVEVTLRITPSLVGLA